MADGAINLGTAPQESEMKPAMASDKPKTRYPSMRVTGKKELDSLPEGHFHFIGKGKVVHRSSTQREGEPESVSHEIEVHSMKPIKKQNEPAKNLDEQMTKVAKKKMGADDDGDE